MSQQRNQRDAVPDPSRITGGAADAPGPGTPGWVKAFGLVVLVLLIVVVVLFVAGGEHGPGRHLPPGNQSEGPHAASAAISDGGLRAAGLSVS